MCIRTYIRYSNVCSAHIPPMNGSTSLKIAQTLLNTHQKCSLDAPLSRTFNITTYSAPFLGLTKQLSYSFDVFL